MTREEREDAINFFKEVAKREVNNAKYSKLAIEALEQEHWIPVGERLPKDRHVVLFCDDDNDVMIGFHVKGRPDTEFEIWNIWGVIKYVRAWMPLPEPYKED